MNKIVELKINPEVELLGFDAVALVEQPAIEENFYAFNSLDVDALIVEEILKQELFVERLPGESKDSYLGRCIPKMIGEGFPDDQAIAICYEGLSFQDESEDVYELEIGDYRTRHYDMCPGASALYKKIASEEIPVDMGLAIRAARLQDALFWLEKHTVKQMQSATYEDVVAAENLAYEILRLADMMGLREQHSYIGGHIEAIKKVAGLVEAAVDVTGLPDYSNEITKKKFESYTDYPEAAVNAAKRALEWRDSHPEQDCGTPVGWARANQLAKREPISEETIARMASFARHLQYEDVPYSEGCGGLMVDAWGGRAGIEWASRKLEDLRQEDGAWDGLYYDDLDPDTQDSIIDALQSVGISEDSLKAQGYDFNVYKSDANPDAPTHQMMGDYKTLYKYVGPKDAKNRKFCARLLELNLLFRKEDIQKLSVRGANEQFGFYDIFQYKGSFNCRHNWQPIEVFVAEDRAAIVAAILAGQANTEVKKPVETFSGFKFASEDQQIVVGPLMVPDKLILRVDEEGNPYHVFFSRETIKQIAYKMMREKLLDRMNLEHNAANTVNGYLLETWLIEDPEHDKSTNYGFKLPKGTWMGMYKVLDPEVWKMVKEGIVKGFSIEGYFIDELFKQYK